MECEAAQTVSEPQPVPLTTLTDAQLAKIERNRQHALLRRQERLAKANHPYLNPEECVTRVEGTKLIDSGGGFFIEESQLKVNSSAVKVSHPIAPDVYPEQYECVECGKTFSESYLFSHFGVVVCDGCRDDEEKHALITKTEAKAEFLLKDVDIEQREPTLKFIVRKNPHNSRWGSMKLYLKSQIFERALEVWGSEEHIEEEKEKRIEKREVSNQKRFNKKVKELRMAVRSSTYTKDLSGHKHSYGEETYNEEEDVYEKICTTCGQSLKYEKM